MRPPEDERQDPGSGFTVVTRFAPSPTGALHVGGARTALFSWAFARRHGGKFILRLEDTDLARSSMASARGIIADLRWLGIDWDEGPQCPKDWRDALRRDWDPRKDQMGPAGVSYFQSERKEQGIYERYAQRLLDCGRAYKDGEAIRFRMAKDPVVVPDAVLGEVTFGPEQLEDFVIIKSDGFPTFHFAVVVDDELMGVTHVIRGQEHLANTPKHLALQEALGFRRPVYAHLSSILNADGSKMSKRDKAKVARAAAKKWLEEHGGDVSALSQSQSLKNIDAADLKAFLAKENDESTVAQAIASALSLTLPEIEVHDFRESGYLPSALMNYIALLGWSPLSGGGSEERFDLDFLTRTFDLSRVSKSNARFDRDKLRAFNAEAIAALPPREFARVLRERATQTQPQLLKKIGDQWETFAAAYQPRSQTLNDAFSLGHFFALEPGQIKYDSKAEQKVLLAKEAAGLKALAEVRGVLEGCQPFEPPTIHATLEKFASETGRKIGDVAQPLRVAVTGSTVSPPIDQTLALLGKPAVLARIDAALMRHSTKDAP